MLTKSDFKQIRQIIKDEVSSEMKQIPKIVKNEVSSEMKQIPTIVRDEVNVQIKPLREDIEKIRKDVSSIVNFFDNEYLELRQRVERIENHLNLSSIA